MLKILEMFLKEKLQYLVNKESLGSEEGAQNLVD